MARDKKAYETAYTLRNVRDAGKERFLKLFRMFDHVSVSFSGGKDSTACLTLCVEAARELGKLPVRACFFDEECIHPPTVEYVERVRQRGIDTGEVALEWYCLPLKLRNACSNESPWWRPWDPACPELWVRQPPKGAIMEHPAREPDMGIPEFDHCIMRKNECLILGLRTQESLRRYQVCTAKKNDNYIAYHGGYSKAYPIYDWSSVDVWKLVQIEGIDYNRTYDELNRTCLFNNFLGQRVCPPFGDEPLRGLWKYAECWPDLWHKMVKRVPGVNTAWRYANTELYSNTAKPENLTWYEYVELLVANHTEQEVREHIQRRIKELIGRHEAKTDDPLDDEIHHPLSGCSWKFLAAVAAKGDLKNREQQKMLNCANQTLRKLGITLDEARKRYGKK